MELTDDIFNAEGILPRDELVKFIIQGVEDIRDDIIQYQDYDGVTPVVAFIVGTKDGDITACMMHVEGETDPRRIDAKTAFGKDYSGGPDHQVKMEKIQLARLRWRGGLVSDWLSPTEWDWSVQRLSTVTDRVWRDQS